MAELNQRSEGKVACELRSEQRAQSGKGMQTMRKVSAGRTAAEVSGLLADIAAHRKAYLGRTQHLATEPVSSAFCEGVVFVLKFKKSTESVGEN